MIEILLISLLVYVVVSLFAYFAHRSLHQTWTGRWNSSHQVHHNFLYPPSDYTSDKYRDAGKDNTFWVFSIISLPLLITPIILYFIGWLSGYLAIMVIVEMLFIGWLNSYLHDVLHLKNHWMSRIPVIKILFIKLQDLHYIHHVHQNMNLGIFSFIWDKVFRTFSDEKL